MLYSLTEICNYLSKRIYLFLPATTGSNKIVIYNLVTRKEVGILSNTGTDPCTCFIVMAKEILRYITDNTITKSTSLNDDLLKQIFEDVIPETKTSIETT